MAAAPDAKRAKALPKVNVLMCGTGEYTTGYVHDSSSKSDKAKGVIGLCMFELRRLGRIGRVACVGTNGTKFPGIREHLKTQISDVYAGLDVSMDTYPNDNVPRDTLAYLAAIESMHKGDIVTVFTPDDTHFDICKVAIKRGLHVLVTKPAVMTVDHHEQLQELARRHNVLVMVEFHKRWDPIYTDARGRARELGDFSYFYSFMSQPKLQLETFKAWAGKSSDISYYLNSHHIDAHAWQMEGRGQPVRVVASAATGIASSEPFNCPEGAEDTISIMATWKNEPTGNLGTAIYTSSWGAPKGEVHSQQRFHYMGHEGDIAVDQAHRGYLVTTDKEGYKSINPLYMAYVPGPDGHFNGHNGYGYKSIDAFVAAAQAINNEEKRPEDFDAVLPTLHSTIMTTVVLEAGRQSLDLGRPIDIACKEGKWVLTAA
ncbi:uncharacterized protein MONBRDRAFT_32677 [Monosiga brevicollis MX1]|uniref:Gfo/Idh/MocA-like oxidoreductase N-terminal domain-containing protein n=1 Tax=Monosiga brevicollis TaxID=81824 RepID=A9V125_MONBE|nr:uncharacterized protein MONBRDRAFT_32677 [Monosiga brevicollis MX1]EDQ88734.1 predicted protein [Monosiga brevicollis MX1]|eukprot:XP_001746347.1 hypothetical protein [Monosiga brevicollis MX1]